MERVGISKKINKSKKPIIICNCDEKQDDITDIINNIVLKEVFNKRDYHQYEYDIIVDSHEKADIIRERMNAIIKDDSDSGEWTKRYKNKIINYPWGYKIIDMKLYHNEVKELRNDFNIVIKSDFNPIKTINRGKNNIITKVYYYECTPSINELMELIKNNFVNQVVVMITNDLITNKNIDLVEYNNTKTMEEEIINQQKELMHEFSNIEKTNKTSLYRSEILKQIQLLNEIKDM